jgi:hypothetical protein
MAAAATVGPNSGDFGHGRAREVGGKNEEREGVRFHALPAAEMHCRDRISIGKRAAAALFVVAAICSWRQRCSWWLCWAGVVALQERGRQGTRAAHGLAGKRRRRDSKEMGGGSSARPLFWAAGACPCSGGLQGGAAGQERHGWAGLRHAGEATHPGGARWRRRCSPGAWKIGETNGGGGVVLLARRAAGLRRLAVGAQEEDDGDGDAMLKRLSLRAGSRAMTGGSTSREHAA